MTHIEPEAAPSWWTRLTQALIRDPAIILLDTHDDKSDADTVLRAPLHVGESVD
jgi:hypothetical protein